MTTKLLPPPRNDIHCKFRGVDRLPYGNVAQIMRHIVDAIWDGATFGITRKIVCVDIRRLLTPLGSAVVKETQQLLFLGINTDARPTCFLKGYSLAGKVLKLLVAIWMWFGIEPFDIAFGSDVVLAQ